MSRKTTQTGSFEGVPSGVDSTHSSNGGVTNQGNGYNGSSNTTYAQITATTGANVSSYISYTFSVTGIPSNATITGVSCTAKGRVSSTSYLPTAVHQLYAGGTAKGSSTSFASTTASARSVSGGTSWTVSEVSNVQIRSTVTRGTSSTTRSANFRFYGASLTVSYSYMQTEYEITVTNNTTATVGYDQWVIAGDDTVITSDTMTGITVTDNGNDVTNQFVSGQSGSESSVPTSYTAGASINGTNYQSTIGKGSDTANRTGNDYFSTTQGGSGSTYIDYHFDFSAIPSTATISSMSVTVKGHCESTSESREISRVQCYTGTTAKGSYVDMTDSTTDKVYTISSPGTWTRAELQDARIKHTIGVYGGLMSGATWVVNYTSSGYAYTIANIGADHVLVFSSGGTQAALYVKRNGSWVQIAAAYKKANGTWSQVSLDSAFESGVNYVAG